MKRFILVFSLLMIGMASFADVFKVAKVESGDGWASVWLVSETETFCFEQHGKDVKAPKKDVEELDISRLVPIMVIRTGEDTYTYVSPLLPNEHLNTEICQFIATAKPSWVFYKKNTDDKLINLEDYPWQTGKDFNWNNM